MTKGESKAARLNWKALLAVDENGLRALVQEVLEAEMSEALQAEKGERTPGRLGHRSGYYERTPVTRIGVLELRVPQDRAGRFSFGVWSNEALPVDRTARAVAGLKPLNVRSSPERSGTKSTFQYRCR